MSFSSALDAFAHTNAMVLAFGSIGCYSALTLILLGSHFILKKIENRTPIYATPLLPTLSFEMRSALNDVIGYTELIYQNHSLSLAHSDYLREILSSSKIILENINMLETTTRKKVTIEMKNKLSFSVRTQLNTVVGFASLLHDTHNVANQNLQLQREYLGLVLNRSDDILQLTT